MLNKKPIRVINLLIISTILIFASIYVYFIKNTPVIPECSATLKINISDNRSSLNGFYLLSIIPNKNDPTHHTFVMNGDINYNGKDYSISRKYLIKHSYQGDHFFSRIESISIDPSDQAGENIKIRGIPQVDQLYFTKIKQLNDNNYIIEENFSPLFICTH